MTQIWSKIFHWSWNHYLVMKRLFGPSWNFLVRHEFIFWSWNFSPSWITTFGRHEIFPRHESQSGHGIILRHDSLLYVMKFTPCVMKSIFYVMHHHNFSDVTWVRVLNVCGGGHLNQLISTCVCPTPQVSGTTPTPSVGHNFYWLVFMNGTPSCTQHRHTRERSSNMWWHMPTHSTILNPFWRPDISSIPRFWGVFLHVSDMGCLQPRPGIVWRA